MLLKSTLSLVAAASLASATAVARAGNERCVNDSCMKAVRNSGNYGWWDCYFARRVTTTPSAYTAWSTVTRTVNATTTTVEPYSTDITTTLSYTDTSTETSTETPTTTYSTTSTIQPYAGSGAHNRRMPEPAPAPTAGAAVARAAPLGHFPLAVALAAETGAPSKRASAPLGHFPLDALPEAQQAAAVADLTKRAGSCPSRERYLSACACNGVPKATVTQVRKTVRSTRTTYVTSTYQATSTSTSINTYSESTTSTTTTQTTTTTTSTTTYSTSIMATPTCTSFRKGPSPAYMYQYNLEYVGFKTLNDASPASRNVPAITNTLPGTMSTCDAADNCIGWAANTFNNNGGGAYFAINLRFRPDTTDWLCVAYYDQTPASYYNVDSPGVGQSFGWTKRP